jgi:NAD(P)-dependent dehydrogenase (short-subunit alcohol dehydrogenase family)
MSYRAQFDLSGKTALVTGACGILGQCFTEGLAEFGANLVVVDLDAEAAATLAGDLADHHGVRTVGIAADIADPAAVETMATQAFDAFGRIDVLHNNAGNPPMDPARYFAAFENYDLEDWRHVIGVDLDGTFLVARAVGGRMAESGHSGSVIQTASIYGAMGSDQRIYEGSEYEGRAINNPAAYSTGKAGVIGLTKWLATNWAEKGIRVNAIAPGGVESGQNETFTARYSARVPLGRMARREELVGALIWLASDASSYVTGQTIFVDGGLSAW